MNAEQEKAKKLSELLDGFRAEAGLLPEERDSLGLRARLQALAPDVRERAELRGRNPALQTGARKQGHWLQAVEVLAAVILLAAAIAGLPRLIGSVSKLPAVSNQPTATATASESAKPTHEAGTASPLALAPEVCAAGNLTPFPQEAASARFGQPELSGGLLGGGELESGDFVFQLWLACDPVFQRSSGGGDASEIDGLGLVLGWAFNGANQEGRLTTYAGVEPYVSETGSTEPVGTGSGGEIHGLSLPQGVIADWQAADSHLRYVLKAQLPDGSLAGAALTFTLVRGADGFRPQDIRLVPLSYAELAGPTASEMTEPPFPLLNASQVYPGLAEIEALLAKRQKEIVSGAGWIHQVIREYSARGAYLAENTKNFTSETWVQLDYQGNVIASITRVTTDDGRPLQLAVTRDGQSYNFTTGEGSAAQPYPVRTDWGLLDALLEKARAGRTVTRADETINGRAAWVFIFTDNYDTPINFGDGKNVSRLENRMAVDTESGAYLSSELIKYFEDGTQSLDSQQTVVTEERVDQPPDDALALFNHEHTVYTPPAAADSLGVAGRDFSRSDLKLVSLPGDDFSMPSFWYGDIYAGDAYLGRVDFGATPGGWCERSASGETLAFKRETILNSRPASTTLNWFALSDLRQVYVASEALQVTSALSWSPVEEKLVFTGCMSGGCGLYLLDAQTNSLRLLAGMETTVWQPLWKPDGTQVAVAVPDAFKHYVVDASSGEVVYQGPFDQVGWQVGADSPAASWGVNFAKEWQGNCFKESK